MWFAGFALGWDAEAGGLTSTLSRAAIMPVRALKVNTGHKKQTPARIAGAYEQTIFLCINSALLDGVGHSINRQHIGRNAVVNVMGLRVVHHIVKRGYHDALKLLIYQCFFPEVALAVLHPLKVGSGYATRVRQDVGNHEDAFVSQHLIGSGGGRSVRALGQNLALHPIHVPAGDLVFGGCRNQDFAILGQQFRWDRLFGAGKALNRSVLLPVFPERLYIDAVLVVKSPSARMVLTISSPSSVSAMRWTKLRSIFRVSIGNWCR